MNHRVTTPCGLIAGMIGPYKYLAGGYLLFSLTRFSATKVGSSKIKSMSLLFFN